MQDLQERIVRAQFFFMATFMMLKRYPDHPYMALWECELQATEAFLRRNDALDIPENVQVPYRTLANLS